MADGDPLFNHLFLALPELMINKAIRQAMLKEGLITAEGEAALARALRAGGRVERIKRATAGKPVFQRLVAVAPELLTVSTVNFLRKRDLLSEKEGHVLRLAIRGIGAIRGGRNSDDIVKRAARVFGVGFSEEMVNLLRASDLVGVDEARKMRILINSGEAAVTAGKKALRAKSLVDWLMLSGSTLVDGNTLRALKLSGVINSRTANALMEAANYGSAQWTVWEGAKRADGLAARMAYVVSGSFSWEGLAFLRTLGIYNPKYDYLLKIAVDLSSTYNRRLMEQLTNRRFRVQPNEAPIKAFARASKESEGSLLRLLSQAAEESRKDAIKMRGLSSAQRAVRANALHKTMRELWEGVGHLTIFNEAKVSEAAAEAMGALQKAYTKQLPGDVQRMLVIQSKSGLDSYISRKENTKKLSSLVYGNLNLWNRKVDKRININLLKGSSADELAKDISRFISPRTPGGVAYAARRLARTELANAFHFTTIRYGREMPWVQGYKWNLSGSHPSSRPDICNEYAEDDHDNMGAGVFKKRNVPGKPHPNCLCYLTYVQPDEDTFIRNMKRGQYDRYMQTMMKSPDIENTMGTRAKSRAFQAMSDFVLPAVASSYVRTSQEFK